MDSIAETMQVVLRRKSEIPGPVRVPIAREIMTTKLTLLRPEQTLADVIELLLKARVSGAPVVDEHGELIGMLSQMDCLTVIAAGSYHQEELAQRATARSLMTKVVCTIGPQTDIYSIAQTFLQRPFRRLPVVEGTKLLGQVSPRDVLRGVLKHMH